MSFPVAASHYPDVPDVPDVSAGWYLDVAGLGAASPGFVQALSAFATDAVIVVFAVMFVAMWWRARRGPTPDVSRAVLAPVVVALAYVVSEVVKSMWQEDRPCRVLGDVITVVPCPEFGDWSFPSNHSTIAGASAVAILWSSRWLGGIALGLAVLAAASRVFVGVHYPHDVLVGLLLGMGVATVLPLLVRVLTPVFTRLRGNAVGTVLLGRELRHLSWEDDRTVVLPKVPK